MRNPSALSLHSSRACLLLALVLTLVVAGIWPSVVLGVDKRISDDSLVLHFDTPGGAVSRWLLPGINAHGALERDLALPARRQLMVDGEIAGQSLAQWRQAGNGWEVSAHDEVLISLRLAPSGAPFVLHKQWRVGENNWRASLELELEVIGEAVLAAEDINLWLTLGPGLGEMPVEGFGIAAGMYSFTEAIFSEAGGVSRERLQDTQTRLTHEPVDGLDWAGLHSRYFALMVAPAEGVAVPYLQIDSQAQAQLPADFTTRMRVQLPFGTLAQGQSQTLSWRVFGGPKSHAALAAASPDLTDMLFPGLWNWMRWLALGIMFVLGMIHSVIPSWGLAIILLAIVVRILVHPVARNAMRAQQRFARTQELMRPEMDEIRRHYKGGEQSERILQLFEKHGVSPLAGLKPLLIVLIQIPVFVALFHLLGQVFELRDASFLWMASLAEPDRLFSWGVDLPFFGTHFNLLPVLMAGTTMLSIHLAPGPESADRQGLRRYLMPVLITLAFFLLFYPFPSGLVLYWTMANLLHLGHALIVNRKRDPADAKAGGLRA